MGLKYIKELVYERPLDTQITAIDTAIPVEVRTVSIEDIKSGRFDGIKLASGDDPVQHNEALGRLFNGCICFIALIENNMAGFAWINFQKRKYEPAIERVETFNDDEALIYNTFVFSEYRRKGVGSKLNEMCLRYLKSKGYKRSLVYINANNVPSIISFTNLGFRVTKYIILIRLFKYKGVKENIIK